MENLTVGETRSRSRSKTPFLRSSCDHESCTEVEDHTHKSGRKTPIKRSTPIKHLGRGRKGSTEGLALVKEVTRPVSSTMEKTHYSRNSTKVLVKTSDYSSEESLDRVAGHKEAYQNEINSQHERVSSNSYSALDDVTLSPIQTSRHVTRDRSTRFGSPAYSACSTDSSFAEQALADTSLLLTADPVSDHLPSRLYKMAGEYWNKYPKTDYTYSPLSKDRVELAPGQVAMPNMSRRSLSQFRVQGPVTSADEVDRLAATTAWTTSTLRKRYTSVESSDDESAYIHKAAYPADERWWITRLLVSMMTAVSTSVSTTYRKVVGPSHRYPYTDRNPRRASVAARTAAVAAVPFVWIYTLIKTITTTTVTTITETFTPNHVSESEKYIGRSSTQAATKRRWWPWLLLLLLPALGYGSHYTYENWDHLAVPNFTDFHLDLTEFTNRIPSIPVPNITLADLNILPKINFTLPDINITLPDISDNLPEMRKTYREYKDIVQNRVADASDYMSVVAESCYEEMRRFWRGVLG